MKVQKPDPRDELICVVDGSDRIVNNCSRGAMRKAGLLHRVTYLLVFNTGGEILVQTRTETKDWYPGYLDLAAGGVVQAGESYQISAQRELFEELGIDVPLYPRFKMYFEDRKTDTRSWGMVYHCISDGPFSLQPEEVASVRFMSIDYALSIDSGRVTPDTRMALLASRDQDPRDRQPQR